MLNEKYYTSVGPILSSFFMAMGNSNVQRYTNELFLLRWILV
jgi:hypothetical protein